MNYVDFVAGNESYKLRLNTRNIMALEKQIGGNPLSIFGKGDRVPPLGEMIAVLHASMQAYHHGITLNKAQDIFDSYLEDGNTMVDFIPVILEIYRASGIISANEEKN